MKKNTKQGFTLIELMVVIAIIGFLSSVVLSSLADARSKANATKFRSEIKQMVNALELYKNTNGKYPYEDTLSGAVQYFSKKTNNNVESFSAGGSSLSSLLTPFLKNVPDVPTNSYNPVADSWIYYSNKVPGNGVDVQLKCAGDTTIPKYVIIFSYLNPTTINAFSELPLYEQYVTGPGWIGADPSRCYSLK